MIKDIFMSFRDNLKEKTTNPFLATYILVWLMRNWDIVYSVFNFDQKSDLKYKLTFIEEYYEINSFLGGIFRNIGWTFCALILTYLLLNISRAIVNLYEKQLKPWIYKLTDSKSIVLKTTYERVRNERDELQVRLDKERESKSKLEIRIKNLEEDILKRERIVDEKKAKVSIDTNNNEEFSDAYRLFYKLREENLINDFKKVVVKSKKGEYISNSHKPIDRYIELGLLEYNKVNYNSSSKQYNVIKDGEDLMKYLRKNDYLD
jgi:hypothetical protein